MISGHCVCLVGIVMKNQNVSFIMIGFYFVLSLWNVVHVVSYSGSIWVYLLCLFRGNCDEKSERKFIMIGFYFVLSLWALYRRRETIIEGVR